MAILKVESNRGFIGRVGNTVTYLLNGQIVKRTIGKSSKEATIPQLSARQKTKIITGFLNPVKEFINIGFEFEARLVQKKSAYNIATSYNWLNAITGEYPDQKIDFSKVLLSRGKMPATNNIEVKFADNRITFKWDETIVNERMKGSDRVMLLAYIPQENRAVSLIGGAERLEGGEHLVIPECYDGIHIETYVSFVSADYKSISNSVHCGSFIK
jgi:hypothetical protein